MPLQKSGSAANAGAILRDMGEVVSLADGTTIQGILRQRTDYYDLDVGSQIRKFTVLWVPSDALGTLAVGQDVVVDGNSYYVSSMNADRDGWTQCDLSDSEDGDGLG